MTTLARDTELPAVTIEKNLFWLITRKLLVQLDGYYIALAVRPRDELIYNCVALAGPDRRQPQTDRQTVFPLYQDTRIAGST
jgi:hypothetical protein